MSKTKTKPDEVVTEDTTFPFKQKELVFLSLAKIPGKGYSILRLKYDGSKVTDVEISAPFQQSLYPVAHLKTLFQHLVTATIDDKDLNKSKLMSTKLDWSTGLELDKVR